MKKTELFFLYMLIITIQTACVSTKKYNELKTQYEAMGEVEENYERRIDALKTQNQRLEYEMSYLKDETQRLQEKNVMRGQVQSDEVRYWEEKYKKLEIAYNELLQNSSLEATKLRQELSKTNPNYAYLSFQDKSTSPTNGQNNAFVNNAINDNKILTSGQNLQTNPLMGDLQRKILEIFSRLNTNEFQIESLPNQINVALLDDFLFASDSTQLTKEGIFTLKNLTQLLKSYPQVKVFVESGDLAIQNRQNINPKANTLGNLFKSEQIPYELNQKSTTPLAFQTTGTLQKSSKTILILKLP